MGSGAENLTCFLPGGEYRRHASTASLNGASPVQKTLSVNTPQSLQFIKDKFLNFEHCRPGLPKPQKAECRFLCCRSTSSANSRRSSRLAQPSITAQVSRHISSSKLSAGLSRRSVMPLVLSKSRPAARGTSDRTGDICLIITTKLP